MNLKIVYSYLPGKVSVVDESLKGAAYHVLNKGGTLHMLKGPASAFVRSIIPKNFQEHDTAASLGAASADAVIIMAGDARDLTLAQLLEPNPDKLISLKGAGGKAATLKTGIIMDDGLTPGPFGTLPYMITIQSALDSLALKLPPAIEL